MEAPNTAFASVSRPFIDGILDFALVFSLCMLAKTNEVTLMYFDWEVYQGVQLCGRILNLSSPVLVVDCHSCNCVTVEDCSGSCDTGFHMV